MNARMSPTVWWKLKCTTMRVPSPNLNWTEVDGNESSTVRATDEENVLLEAEVMLGSEDASLVDDPLPKVLPTPWNGTYCFSGSWKRREDKKTRRCSSNKEWTVKSRTHRVISFLPYEINMNRCPPISWLKLFWTLRLPDTLHMERSHSLDLKT